MLRIEKFFEASRMCKLFAKILTPYSGHHVGEFFEQKINGFRIFNTNLDGYDICIFYMESKVENYVIKTIQVFSKNAITLPFHIVYKVAVEFLGHSKENIFFSFLKNGTTVFCWTKIEFENGDSAPLVESEVDVKTYMGKYFSYIEE